MSDLRLAPATVTFTDRLVYRYGDVEVHLIAVGPAHTWGDVVVYLPPAAHPFAADIAFFYVIPPAHNGRITQWIGAIDRIMAMDVDVIVPGHGRGHQEGTSRDACAAGVDLGRFAAWTNPERNAWNAVRLYAELAGTLTPATDLAAQNEAVAEYNRAMVRRANVR